MDDQSTWLERPGLTQPKLEGSPRRSPWRVMLGSTRAAQDTGSGSAPTVVLVMLLDLKMESSMTRSPMVRPMAPECTQLDFETSEAHQCTARKCADPVPRLPLAGGAAW